MSQAPKGTQKNESDSSLFMWLTKVNPAAAKFAAWGLAVILVVLIALRGGILADSWFDLLIAVPLVAIFASTLTRLTQDSQLFRAAVGILFLAAAAGLIWRAATRSMAAPAPTTAEVGAALKELSPEEKKDPAPSVSDTTAVGCKSVIHSTVKERDEYPAGSHLVRNLGLQWTTHKEAWIDNTAFKIPCAGVYFISWGFVKNPYDGGSTDDVSLQLWQETKALARAWAGQNPGRVGGTQSTVVRLNAGDSITLWAVSSQKSEIRELSFTLLKVAD